MTGSEMTGTGIGADGTSRKRTALLTGDAAMRGVLAAMPSLRELNVIVEPSPLTAGSYADTMPDVILLACSGPRDAWLRDVIDWRHLMPAVPLLVVTAMNDASEVLAVWRAGASDLLPWPLRDPELEAALNRVADSGAPSRAQLESQLQELRDDEEAGRRVQLRILPQTPFDTGWCRVEHRIAPSLYLSGDFVDYFEVGEKCLAFYLADVSGHGVSSAFVTMFLKTIGNRARRELRRDPANLARPSLMLDLANRELLALGLGKHVTMFCGIVDFSRRELRCSMAGQYPQPIVFDGKCAEYLGGRGMPLGLLDAAVYEDRMHALPEGFVLVAFSDGVLELVGAGSLAEKEARLLAMVSDGGVTVDALGRAMQLDDGRILPDDVAMLVIREGGRTVD